jgi:hypothetical protein
MEIVETMILHCAISLDREKFLQFKSDALNKLVDGAVYNARLLNPEPNLLKNYIWKYLLQSHGLRQNDDNSVLLWLQEHTAKSIGLFIYVDVNDNIGFALRNADEFRTH